MSEETRQHVSEIEINTTPDRVFSPITEAEQIVRWFAPEAKVEPGPDGNGGHGGPLHHFDVGGRLPDRGNRGRQNAASILKHGLERHPGIDCATVSVTVPSSIAPAEAWRRLPLDGLKPGDRYSIQALEGVVTTSYPPEHFGGVVENLNNGLLSLYCHATFLNATFILWGPARDRAKQLETEWTEVLKEAVSSA